MKLGLIHIYCGDGKGKTTASLGLAARCAGRGNQVLIVQFLKSQNTGELHSLGEIPGITFLRGQEAFGFYDESAEQKEKRRAIHDELLVEAINRCRERKVDLLILDEIIGSYNYDLIDRNLLLEFLRSKPENLEVVLTGRGPSDELIELADYVSEVKKIKHPYDKGINARIGIER
ncbi:cob(I)yrinic acid a,c-diamide adenosyltransferase [Dehalobacter sp. DCM]|uniref:cob(I)yrinic acid a,c-diamide adenosyltransferase n=1 Tax=Dehalobacter sp. DCM TaxID=2907827 RepID=UPI0030819A3C|nr:cob(I)yrinic acid a,c-diamide adenosyltransferase [Dehalobacter sp. DCM]